VPIVRHDSSRWSGSARPSASSWQRSTDSTLGLVHAARASDLTDQIAACVVAARSSQSGAVALDLLRHGHPVIAPMPVAADPGDARLVMEVARRAGLPLVPLTPWRNADDVRRARSIALAGALGTVRSVRVHAGPRLAGPGRTPGPDGTIAELLPAAADLVRFLVGPVQRVLAVHTGPGRGPRPPAVAPAGRAVVHALLLGGVHAELAVGWGEDDDAAGLVVIAGDAATLSVGWTSSVLRHHGGGDLRIGDGYRPVEALAAALQHALDVVEDRGGTAATTVSDDIRAAIEVVEAAQRSARRAAWEDVRGVPVLDLSDPVLTAAAGG
jgi:predicted dehydrogenase